FTPYALRSGLPTDRVLPCLAVLDGCLWIGPYAGGVARLRRDGRFTPYDRRQGLSSEFVLSLAQDRFGRVWVGTDGGGLNVLEGGRGKTYTTEQGLAKNSVFRIYQDAAGTARTRADR